jgi:hypothetical protein
MKLIINNERRPNKDGIYYTENSMGEKCTAEFIGGHWYPVTAHPIAKWLDEESNDPVFSLEDMKLCWIMCDELHSERSGHCLPAKFYKEFMKTKYNIDHE